MHMMVMGANGQLGTALQTALKGHSVSEYDLPELDITDKHAVRSVIAAEQPDVVINAAAYTNVDGCVRDPALAYRANALGPHNLALVCAELDLDLVHISTNEVFPGERPDGYNEWDAVRPINAYGNSKAAGEFNVRQLHRRHYIVRTAWLYARGGRNFIHSILRHARENGAIRVVTDEIGNPTYVEDLADAIVHLIATRQYGTYHLVNAYACSRWEFANAILEMTGLTNVSNTPILSSEFTRLSTPPAQCALNNNAAASFGITLRPWREALAAYIATHLTTTTES